MELLKIIEDNGKQKKGIPRVSSSFRLEESWKRKRKRERERLMEAGMNRDGKKKGKTKRGQKERGRRERGGRWSR